MAPRYVVVMPFTTTLTISDLPTPRPTALVGYIPVYNARPDGSLITLRYMREIRYTNLRLFVIGFFLMLFARNTIVSVDYLRRSRSKDKTLFYLLVISQLLGPICFISLAASFLSLEANCRAVHTIALVSSALSQALLITGILGIKAYRCLDQSRIVLLIISIVQFISSALLCLDVSRLHSFRMASGVCEVAVNVHMATLALFFQSFFICGCFTYTVWKASAYTAAQGRLSLAGTLETVNDEADPSIVPGAADLSERRGWWDYVPDRRIIPENHGTIADTQSVFSQISRALGMITDTPTPGLQRITPVCSESIHPEHPLPPPARTASHYSCMVPRLSEKSQSSAFRGGNEYAPQGLGRSRALGRISRIRFVRAAMRDELLHTAAVAANSILTVMLSSVGFLRYKLTWTPTMWLGVNWMITSLIVMHSFSRVVKRHEREAILREPSAWDTRNRCTGRREEWQPTPSLSLFSVASYRRPRRYIGSDAQSAAFSSENPFRGSLTPSSVVHGSTRVSEVPDPFQGSVSEYPLPGSGDTGSRWESRKSADSREDGSQPTEAGSSPPPTPCAEFCQTLTQNAYSRDH